MGENPLTHFTLHRRTMTMAYVSNLCLDDIHNPGVYITDMDTAYPQDGPRKAVFIPLAWIGIVGDQLIALQKSHKPARKTSPTSEETAAFMRRHAIYVAIVSSNPAMTVDQSKMLYQWILGKNAFVPLLPPKEDAEQ
jgi:hypothetical protein